MYNCSTYHILIKFFKLCNHDVAYLHIVIGSVAISFQNEYVYSHDVIAILNDIFL